MENKIKIIFRVDSGSIIGIGHIMRCLNLAKKLTEKRNNEIKFICKDHEKNLSNLIKKNFFVNILPIKKNVTNNKRTWLGSDWIDDCNDTINIIKNNNIDVLIVDHYTIDYKWEEKIRSYVKKIVVIDDIYDRKHICDILIDQNLYFDNPYKDLVPKYCKVLLGPEYIMLNDNFLKIKSKEHNGKINRIHICFGGSDIYNITEKIIDILYQFRDKILDFDNIVFDVIIGSTNKFYNQIKNKLNNYKLINFNIYYNVENMAELLNKADLCIGSTGISTYERLYLGIPSIIITIANNQINVAKTFENINAIEYLCHFNSLKNINLVNKINSFINNNRIKKISYKLKKIVDGKGCDRLTNIIIDI